MLRLIGSGLFVLALGGICRADQPLTPSISVVPFRLAKASDVNRPAWDSSVESRASNATDAESMFTCQPVAGEVSHIAVTSEPAADVRSTEMKNGGSASSVVTVTGSLAMVIGCFLLFAWVMRRAMPRSASSLPREAVEVIGRTPLNARQHLQLVRFGNKLLLLAVSSGAVETVGEISDLDEVDFVLDICQQRGLDVPSERIRDALRHVELPSRRTAESRTRNSSHAGHSRPRKSTAVAR